MGPISLLKKLRDIGVPENMAPEDAKHVQIVNLVTALFVAAAVGFIQWFLSGWSEAVGPASVWVLSIEVCTIVLLMPVFVLNWRRYWRAARVYSMLIGTLVAVSYLVVEGRDIMNHYWFIFFSALAFLVFPRTERKLMVAIAAIEIVLFAFSDLIYDHLGPLLHYSAEETISSRNGTLATMFFAFLVCLAISRWFTDRAEGHLHEERNKLVDANQYITRLGDKLKLYLPRQFVESLARGESDVSPDHRRRRLTVFFSDVQGFTRWTDKLEPEEVREILNTYLSEMSAIADKWGGTIDKFIGDALMIFFGDPEYTNDKDHALRCVRMAMEMQERMEELRKGWRKMAYDEPLNIRIGINTGWATVGNFGSEDRLNYTALGSAVNLASRIENACAPDRITVSHTTYLLIEDEIRCEPKGEIEVKGFAEPVKIYEVIGGN